METRASKTKNKNGNNTMPEIVKAPLPGDDEMNDTDTEKHHRGGHGPAPEKGAHESRLCPPPRLQAYCLDHFLMECEIYHEQENNRYHKLVAHSRQMFLEKQSQDNSSNQPASAPMRLQPSRRAKENRSNAATPEPTALRGPPSRQGRPTFHTVQDNVATTPRKLAPPAPMHDIHPQFIGGNVKESGLMFRGINFFVDVCGNKTMIILVDFKGLLDLCVELSEEEEALPDSPTSLFARLSSIESKPRGTSAAGAKRRTR
ncbi:hypothetical protein EKO27_g6469 [Xylaria grammica]|uniref:Uncharacterized protein n=1 Tax=Xylaria grammica TaxID=363999 RepID=A0A439D2I2_9PEZI|nr:hypothetical protein EKO27_g6469 [Xylaria grammica]